MANEAFLSRWSRRKMQARAVPEPPLRTEAETALTADAQASLPALPQHGDAAGQEQHTGPTLEDVARLAAESDYRPFVARGVDEGVKRAALKKLFSDPHFNVMDGLDTYIEDYNKFVPLAPQVLAALRHARGLLDPLSVLEARDTEDAADSSPDLASDQASDGQALKDESAALTAPENPPPAPLNRSDDEHAI